MMDYTLIIPHYRRDANLRHTLRGITCQTLEPSEVIIVEMGDGPNFIIDYPFDVNLVKMEQDWKYLPIAKARNIGALHSQSENLVFLDVDCIPAPDFCEKIVAQAIETKGLVMGSPKYLCFGKDRNKAIKKLPELSIFHPSRPLVQGLRVENDYNIFWSLCFSISRSRFEEVGGFDDGYCGYAVEDTDFGQKLQHAGIPFYLSEAEVYHQQHPVHSPPINHLDSIVRNANHFRRKWGYWPMADCLNEFRYLGLVDWDPSGDEKISIRSMPSKSQIRKTLMRNVPFR